MKKYIKILFLFVPIFSMAQQVDRTKAPAPAKAPVIQVGTPASFELPNGLKVFVVKNTKLPRVTATIALDLDGFVEGDKAGLADMAGQLLKRGTTTKSKAALDEADMSLVEWPEKAPNLVPDNAVVVHIEILDPNRRRIYINHV
jgi:hypothetical protein